MDGKSFKPVPFLLAMSMLIVLVGSAFTSSPAQKLRDAADTPPGPDRYSIILVDYNISTWWMMRFDNGAFVCEIVIEHDGQPTPEDVYIDCGKDVYNVWVNQNPCTETKSRQCDGYYIFQVDSVPTQKEVAVELPPAKAWVSLEGCSPIATSNTNLCEFIPQLVITGEEPLPDEEITGIAGFIGNEPFQCGSPCHILLAPTDEDGVMIEFWAYSSYGDSSETYTAQVRLSADNEGNPDQSYWYVDVISSQWTGEPIASCAESWDSFPPVGGPPFWLTTPNRVEDLNSRVPYNYLAANLILAGVVDANQCENGGLLPDSYGANTCGVEVAYPDVIDWQNRFDNMILKTAIETQVPAQMLKRLFARESQFWPTLSEEFDTGLGQLTLNGADTTLLWNESFFEKFCPLVLSSERCEEGYLHLDDDEKEALRMGLINTVDSTCEDCPLGIDLTRADFSVNVFGHTLLANCEQAGRLVRNVSGQAPGNVATYEDLWKFTLVNYNAGPGCLGDAIQATKDNRQPYEWNYVASNLVGVCNLAVEYVEDISK